MPKYQRHPDIEWKEFSGESLLLNLTTGAYFRLNAVGGLIWQMLDGSTPAETIVTAIQNRFTVSAEQAQADFDHFITVLSAQQLIRPATQP